MALLLNNYFLIKYMCTIGILSTVMCAEFDCAALLAMLLYLLNHVCFILRISDFTACITQKMKIKKANMHCKHAYFRIWSGHLINSTWEIKQVLLR